MGAAALRHAALCWWRRCCMTIACSRLCTILSPGPARAPASCCCVSGGLAMLSLILDLHGEHSFSKPGDAHPLSMHHCCKVLAACKARQNVKKCGMPAGES